MTALRCPREGVSGPLEQRHLPATIDLQYSRSPRAAEEFRPSPRDAKKIAIVHSFPDKPIERRFIRRGLDMTRHKMASPKSHEPMTVRPCLERFSLGQHDGAVGRRGMVRGLSRQPNRDEHVKRSTLSTITIGATHRERSPHFKSVLPPSGTTVSASRRLAAAPTDPSTRADRDPIGTKRGARRCQSETARIVTALAPAIRPLPARVRHPIYEVRGRHDGGKHVKKVGFAPASRRRGVDRFEDVAHWTTFSRRDDTGRGRRGRRSVTID